MSDGWMSQLLWFDLDNLPPIGMRTFRENEGLRAALAHAGRRAHDLERVCRDQQQHIRSLEAQLLPNLIREVAEQGTL